VSPEIARKLLAVVNNKSSVDALFEYAEERIKQHVKNLIRETDHAKMLAIQGSIQELQRFATLRDEVNQKAKEAKDAKSNSNNQ
jgi:hypothetical protein